MASNWLEKGVITPSIAARKLHNGDWAPKVVCTCKFYNRIYDDLYVLLMRDLALLFTVQLAFLHYTRRSAAITFTAVCTLCTIDKCPRTVVRVRIVISTPYGSLKEYWEHLLTYGINQIGRAWNRLCVGRWCKYYRMISIKMFQPFSWEI